MTLRRDWYIWLAMMVGTLDLWASPSSAQTTAPAAPSSTPAAEAQPLPAVVTQVEGTVEWAAAGVSATAAEGWTAVKVNEELKPGVQIRTGLRSHVNLRFGETTVVSLRSATYASLDQLYRSANVENVRIGLGYGTVRGGSSEGTLKSDVVVDSPVATLAKRGTEGWEIQVESGTDRFRVSLAEYGLVEAIQKLGDQRTRSKLVQPGEYATQANIADLWLEQEVFDHNVVYYTPEGMTEADAEYTLNNTRGMGVMAPGGGTEVVSAAKPVSASYVMEQLRRSYPAGSLIPNTAIGLPRSVDRPEGNFGTPTTFRAVLRQDLAPGRAAGAGRWQPQSGAPRLQRGALPRR